MLHLLINADSADLRFQNVGLILTDPPYGITGNEWDAQPVDCVALALANGLLNGHIVSTADMTYAAYLISRHPELFSHDLVWEKTVGSGQLNIGRRPLRTHENILIFKVGKAIYNRIKTAGEPYTARRNIVSKQCYGGQVENVKHNTGERDAKTILKVPNPRVKGGHPTQKPVALYQRLSDMYSAVDTVVLDPFAVSGTILDINNRVTIGVEKDNGYYQSARASRENSICESTPERISFFQNFIPDIASREHAIFNN
jgi:site-specific DNA-methyltransferase (adenine-specific)